MLSLDVFLDVTVLSLISLNELGFDFLLHMSSWFCVCLSAEAILLGFQHYLVMLGTTVLIPTALVPQMSGGYVSLLQWRFKLINTKKERIKWWSCS